MVCADCGSNSYMSKSTRSSGYRETLRTYLKEFMPKFSYLADIDASDGVLYALANVVRDKEMKGSKKPNSGGSERIDIIPYEMGNGDVYFYERNSGDMLTVLNRGNGLFSISGPTSLVEKVGGRGQLSTIWQNMQDNDFFHEKGKK